MVAFFLALAFVLSASAQTNGVQSAPPANRYLLVVETSRSMQGRLPGALNALTELLASGFKGQIRPEDTLGLWTFNEELYTGRFPLQHWSPQNPTAIGNRLLGFLNEQKFEKQASFDKLLPALNQLVKHSPFITIILVTDGEDKIQGTPFDSRINDAFQTWRERQQSARMPFLTVLRGKQGILTDCTVTPAPWPVEMPPLPPELKLLDLAAQKPPSAPKPPSIVPPLIVHGRKPDPAQAATPAPAWEGTNAAAAPVGATTAAVAQLPPAATPAPGPAAAPSAPPPLLASSNPAPTPEAKAEPLPDQPSQMASIPKAAPAASASGALAATNPSAPAAAVRAPTPAASSPNASAHRKPLWPALLVFSLALLGLAILLVFRARPAPTASLITRSLERQHK